MYPKTKRILGEACAPTLPTKQALAYTSTVAIKRDLPGAVILVHGVNDVGTAYGAVERGLCQGLCERLSRTDIRPNAYRNFTPDDRKQPIENPDAVFFRRQASADAYSPVIPFYWGYREEDGFVQPEGKHYHGQKLDRHGNRLDVDGSKGGGPFNNATTTLPDMWGPGAKKWVRGLVSANWMKGDPLRPVLDSPPRTYLVLAAERLAMLVRMIRRYDPNETVSIVAHSQGCLISLLAQAFLAESREAASRPADTLILTHPPYSLIEQFVERAAANWMGLQSERARLETLVNIVQAVRESKHPVPAFETLAKDPCGIVGPLWSPRESRPWINGKAGTVFAERDNRGRVMLYFCPEDVTVGLEVVQGIGWQGVPDKVLQKIGSTASGFCQRVFTMKKRAPSPGAPPDRVATGTAPGNAFVLRVGNESTIDHVAKSERNAITKQLPRESRTINAPALPDPYYPDLLADTKQGEPDPMEAVDPIDAAIATTNGGMGVVNQVIDDPERGRAVPPGTPEKIPDEAGLWVMLNWTAAERERLRTRLWGEKPKTEQPEQIHVVFMQVEGADRPRGTGKLLLVRDQSSMEAQKSWLGRYAAISFHGAIFGNAENHRRVSAYDVAIGRGQAVTDPKFYEYLCAVADWRMKKAAPGRALSSEEHPFAVFQTEFADFWRVEAPAHKALIERTVNYYTNGAEVDQKGRSKLVTEPIPKMVVNETVTQAGRERGNGVGRNYIPTGRVT